MKKNVLFMIPILGIGNIQVNNSNFIINKLESVEEITNYLFSKIDVLSNKLKELNEEVNIKSLNVHDIQIEDYNYNDKGKLIVFNDNNGYMVIGDKFKLYDLKLLENNPFEHIEYDELVFNTINGYSYIENNEIFPINNGIALVNNQIYDGQEKYGDGAIKDPSKYIISRYGNDYTLKSEGSLNGSVLHYMNNRNQTNYSCYLTNKDGLRYGEENCGLVSAYICIDYIMKRYYSSLIDSTSTRYYDPKIEEKEYYDKKLKDSNVEACSLTKENLYFVTRKKAFEVKNAPEGLSLWDSSTIIEKAFEEYDMTINYIEEVKWAKYALEYYKEIDKGRPLLWSPLSSDTYGSHTMAASGYKYYFKNEKWWIFNNSSTIALVEVQDGWCDYTRYFDLNAYTGFGGFARWGI